MSVDLVKIARQRISVDARSHYPDCERDHIECLVQRMADEIERLRAVIRDAGLCIKCGEPIHPNFPCAEARALRSDAAVKEQKK